MSLTYQDATCRYRMDPDFKSMLELSEKGVIERGAMQKRLMRLKLTSGVWLVVEMSQPVIHIAQVCGDYIDK